MILVTGATGHVGARLEISCFAQRPGVRIA
jgi:nucleoside-diphosphate-sugar epimerase